MRRQIGSIILVTGMLLAWQPGASAQDESTALVGSLTSEEMKKVVQFGRGVGQAYTCAKKEARPEMLEDIRLVADSPPQFFGWEFRAPTSFHVTFTKN